MKISTSVNRFTLAIVGAAAVVLLQLGCAMGGAATASGDYSSARGGDATTKVTLTSSIALGDKVATAAADFARSMLAASNGPVSALARQEAIQKGVEEGVRVAEQEGKQVTAEQRQELEQYVAAQVAQAGQGNE